MVNSGFQKPVGQFFPSPVFEDTDHRMYRRKLLFCLWPRSNLGMTLLMLCKNPQRCQGIGAKLGTWHQALAVLLHLLDIASLQLLSRNVPNHFNNLRQSQHTDTALVTGHQKNRSKPLVLRHQTVLKQSFNRRRTVVATTRYIHSQIIQLHQDIVARKRRCHQVSQHIGINAYTCIGGQNCHRNFLMYFEN